MGEHLRHFFPELTRTVLRCHEEPRRKFATLHYLMHSANLAFHRHNPNPDMRSARFKPSILSMEQLALTGQGTQFLPFDFGTPSHRMGNLQFFVGADSGRLFRAAKLLWI